MSWRVSELPGGWKSIRAYVLRRDGHRCTVVKSDGTRCTQGATEVDHIGDRNDHDPDNLRAICSWHHAKRTSQQANKARTRVSTQRPREPHPGLRE